jgi:hypothetical protein
MYALSLFACSLSVGFDAPFKQHKMHAPMQRAIEMKKIAKRPKKRKITITTNHPNSSGLD